MMDAKRHWIKKRLHNSVLYYELQWSSMEAADKHRINQSVPSLPGIWELYWLEQSRKPRLIKMGKAWYGGLRNELRIETDPGESRNASIRKFLLSGDVYYRYCICESFTDMEHIYPTLASIRNWPREECSDEGETSTFSEIRILEPDEMVINRIRRPGEPQVSSSTSHNKVPNMFDVIREEKKIQAEQDKSET